MEWRDTMSAAVAHLNGINATTLGRSHRLDAAILDSYASTPLVGSTRQFARYSVPGLVNWALRNTIYWAPAM